jgi:hypothetical protein
MIVNQNVRPGAYAISSDVTLSVKGRMNFATSFTADCYARPIDIPVTPRLFVWKKPIVLEHPCLQCFGIGCLPLRYISCSTTCCAACCSAANTTVGFDTLSCTYIIRYYCRSQRDDVVAHRKRRSGSGPSTRRLMANEYHPLACGPSQVGCEQGLRTSPFTSLTFMETKLAKNDLVIEDVTAWTM